MKDKLKIGLVFGNLNVGGGSFQLLSLANVLVKNNDVTVFVYKDLTKGNYINLKKNIKIIEANKDKNNNSSIINSLFEPFIVSFGLAKLLLRYKYDILNPHEWPANWACSLVRLRRNVPIVWMCNDVWHLPNFSMEKRLRFKIFNNTFIKITDLFLSLFLNRVIVLDNRIKKIVENYYHKKATVIRSGIEIEDYKNVISKIDVRNKFKLDQDKFIFICSSIFFLHRRFEDAIDAIKIIAKNNRKVQLIILGSSQFDPEYFKAIKNKINKENLSKIVTVNNKFLPNDLFKAYIAASDVYIFPNEKQTWGLAVIEAMALGKPCIVSDGAGVHEIIKEEKNGLTFKCRDVKDLAGKMDKLINNEKLRIQVGKNAKEFVFSSYSWENYADQMVKVFQETVSKKSSC